MLESEPGGNQELETGLPVPFNRRRVVLGQSLPHSRVVRGAWEHLGPTRRFAGKSSCGAEGAGQAPWLCHLQSAGTGAGASVCPHRAGLEKEGDVGETGSLTTSASFPYPGRWVKTRTSQRTVTVQKITPLPSADLRAIRQKWGPQPH